MACALLVEDLMMIKVSNGRLSAPKSSLIPIFQIRSLSDPLLCRQKADIALQARKKAMARKKESEQRQVETLNRKNLAGIRVVQKNLVYVVGLSQKSSEEEFLQTLRGPQYFGQYGKITKIVVSKAKEGQNNANNNNHSIGVYVTFESREDAAKCITAVDGSQNAERTLR